MHLRDADSRGEVSLTQIILEAQPHDPRVRPVWNPLGALRAADGVVGRCVIPIALIAVGIVWLALAE
jgi:hypothetical protein